MPKALELCNQKFGFLLVIDKAYMRNGKGYWNCICDCGQETIVVGHALKSGHTKSCGCLSIQTITTRNIKHGASVRDRILPLYRTWKNMHARCYCVTDTCFADYGGRGIIVCKEWHEYPPFEKYMLSLPHCPHDVLIPGAHPERTIDRIKNDQGYKPGNVRWSTHSEQQNNKRNNIIVTIKGKRMSLRDAIKKYATVSETTVRARIGRGWSIKDAIIKPLNRSRS